jgi:hypothetical protein
VTAPPAGLVQLREKLVVDAEGFSGRRRRHECLRMGEEVQGRWSLQAVAGQQRDVEALGRPQRIRHVGSGGGGKTVTQAQKGKPGHGTRPAPKRRRGTHDKEAEEDEAKASPPQAGGQSEHAYTRRENACPIISVTLPRLSVSSSH